MPKTGIAPYCALVFGGNAGQTIENIKRSQSLASHRPFFYHFTHNKKFIFDEKDRRGVAIDSMVSGGCIISGATVRHSLLFSNVRVEEYSIVESSVILPDVDIGKNCRIRNAVIDKGTIIPDGMFIGENIEADKKRFYVTPKGVVLVTPEMLNQELHHVR